MFPDNNAFDSFSATGVGMVKTISNVAVRAFSLNVKQVGGSGASWTVILEGSIDGTNYSTILTHTDLDPGDGETVFTGAAEYPSTHHRVRCIALNLGTSTSILVRRLAV